MQARRCLTAGLDPDCDFFRLTLVKGDLRGIAAARRISEATAADMRQNLGFALLALGVPVAAGLPYPLTSTAGSLSPMIAALPKGFSSVSGASNALRLRQTA